MWSKMLLQMTCRAPVGLQSSMLAAVLHDASSLQAQALPTAAASLLAAHSCPRSLWQTNSQHLPANSYLSLYLLHSTRPPSYYPGVKDFKVLKTTQSGYEGYLKDQYTLLGETRERMMATSMTATWRYAFQPLDYDAAFTAVRGALVDGVFGPPKGGVYSPSVQYTLYQMALLALERVPQVRGAAAGGSTSTTSSVRVT
jgi:hypothetical protein